MILLRCGKSACFAARYAAQRDSHVGRARCESGGRSLSAGARRLRNRSLGVLAAGLGQAPRALRQAPRQQADRARRLRPDTAAALHRTAAPARLYPAATRADQAAGADPDCRRLSQGRRRAIQFRSGPAAIGSRVQAGLRQGGDGRRAHQGTGGPHLRVRDRRQRHLRRPGRHRRQQPQGRPADLAGDGLQPVAQHQLREPARRARRQVRRRLEQVRSRAQWSGSRGDGAQDRRAEEDDRVQPHRAGRLERARQARQDDGGRQGHPRRGARPRHRAAAADPEAPGLRRVRPHERLRAAADRGRARADELHRRRQRHRHGDDAARSARARADRRTSSSAPATSATRSRAGPARSRACSPPSRPRWTAPPGHRAPGSSARRSSAAALATAARHMSRLQKTAGRTS